MTPITQIRGGAHARRRRAQRGYGDRETRVFGVIVSNSLSRSPYPRERLRRLSAAPQDAIVTMSACRARAMNFIGVICVICDPGNSFVSFVSFAALVIVGHVSRLIR